MNLQAPGQERIRYRQLLERIRETAMQVVPANASIMAISRGDVRMLEIAGRRVSHFPQNELGQYAGFHPADSTSAITHLESLRSKGAEFLLIPVTAFWWLEHYKHFRRHLEGRYAVAARVEDTCVIFSLDAPATHGVGEPVDASAREYRGLVTQIHEVIDALLPLDATVAVLSNGDEALIDLGMRSGRHFPQDAGGRYAGHHPADSAAAIEQLTRLRAGGGEYLVIPQTAFWWLDYYPEFAASLATTSRLVTQQAHVCRVYALGTSGH